MKRFLLPLIFSLLAFSASQSHASHSHFGAGGVFELDLDDSEIPMTPKQERKQKLLEEKIHIQQEKAIRSHFWKDT